MRHIVPLLALLAWAPPAAAQIDWIGIQIDSHRFGEQLRRNQDLAGRGREGADAEEPAPEPEPEPEQTPRDALFARVMENVDLMREEVPGIAHVEATEDLRVVVHVNGGFDEAAIAALLEPILGAPVEVVQWKR
jgi:hypothetical protein